MKLVGFNVLDNIPSFFNSHSGGRSLAGPLGTSATDWPIALALGDYDDGEFGGMKIGRGNRSTRRNPAPPLLSFFLQYLTNAKDLICS
jgi:hypothetical protein